MPASYHSFLLRLWLEEAEETTGWHSQIDNIQTGRRETFDTLDKLLDFLRHQTEDANATNNPPQP